MLEIAIEGFNVPAHVIEIGQFLNGKEGVIQKGALPLFDTGLKLFCYERVQHDVESVIVECAAQSEHGIAVFFQPPGSGALEPDVADMLVCRLNAATA